LLTAWSTAGILGPVLVNYLREYQLAQGVPKAQAYDVTMYVLAGLLALGMLCNLLIRPVSGEHFMSDEQLAKERKLAHERELANASGVTVADDGSKSSPLVAVLAWAAVLLPIAWGAWVTVQKTAVLFK
jgi:hypothetical protein